MANIEHQILNSEDIYLSGKDIIDICRGETHIVQYHELYKYDSIEQLLEEHGTVTLLYEITAGSGHWVCLYYDINNVLNFFDSYAIGHGVPDSDLKYAEYNLKEGRPYLTLLLEKYKKKLIVNDVKLQAFKKDINTCGRWCGVRLLTRKKYTMKEFQNMFGSTFKNNGDFYVSALTWLQTFDK
jgi:hypothetical protein